MELTHEFTVELPVEQAWAVLTDLEAIAPCMPGAQLTEVDHDETGNDVYSGQVKVKVGPITANYKGTASFAELDAAGGRAVLSAEGRETRGQGNARATVTATLVAADDGGTRVGVVTDLQITGKVAQFGRGMLEEVSGKLLDQFVAALSEQITSQGAATPVAGTHLPGLSEPAESPAAETPVTESPVAVERNGAAPAGPRKIDMPEPEAVNLIGTAGPSVAKRLGPVVTGALVALAVVRFVRRRRR